MRTAVRINSIRRTAAMAIVKWSATGGQPTSTSMCGQCMFPNVNTKRSDASSPILYKNISRMSAVSSTNIV